MKKTDRKVKTKVKPRSSKRKFADGGETDKNNNEMDENQLLQQENNGVEGEPPHVSIPEATPDPTPPAPIAEPTPVVPEPAPAAKETVVEEVKKDVVEPVENVVEEVEEKLEKSESSGVLAFFMGAIIGMAFGISK